MLKKMTQRFIVIVYFFVVVECSNLKGVPVPMADVLESILVKFMDNKDYTGVLFDYLKGKEFSAHRTDNLDISVLDVYNVRKLINKAKRKKAVETRRIRGAAYYDYRPESNSVKQTAMDMMKQSIYSTRYRLQETKRFRKHFTNDIAFNIAIFYGALTQISLKLQTLLVTMKKLTNWTHFLWFLVLYEKILAANVDVHNMVDRIFYLHDVHLRRIHGEQVEIAPTIPIPKVTRSRRIRYRRTTTASRARPSFSITGDFTFPFEETTTSILDTTTAKKWTEQMYGDYGVVVTHPGSMEPDKISETTVTPIPETEEPIDNEQQDEFIVPQDEVIEPQTTTEAQGKSDEAQVTPTEVSINLENNEPTESPKPEDMPDGSENEPQKKQEDNEPTESPNPEDMPDGSENEPQKKQEDNEPTELPKPEDMPDESENEPQKKQSEEEIDTPIGQPTLPDDGDKPTEPQQELNTSQQPSEPENLFDA